MVMNEQAIRICEIEGFLPYIELSAVELSREQTSELGGGGANTYN